jgi:hypothetical protein
MEHLAQRNRLKGILLKTPIENAVALKFYDREGFRRVPSEEGNYVLLRRLTDGASISVGVHQPNYLPWLGYFYKMSLCDAFVFLDDVIFPKGSFVNRNRVCINDEAKWLTVPLNRGLQTPINQAFPSGEDWIEKHLRTLEVSYKRAPYFQTYSGPIARVLREASSLSAADLNISLVKLVASWLEIKPQYYKSSELAVDGAADNRLVKIVKTVDGEIYISGSGGANYQSQETFNRSGIALSYTNFSPEPYRQLASQFIPGLAVVDALFNIGAESIREMYSKLTIERQSAATAD